MAIQTLDKTETKPVARAGAEKATAVAASTATSKKERKASRLAGLMERRGAKKGSGRFSMAIWTVFFRGVVLVADYLLALTTAVAVIPMLGAWLHQQSAMGRTGLGVDGSIAMWIAPLLFLVLVLAAGEIAAMRGMWRWATRRINALREAVDAEQAPAPKTTHPNKKTAKKRSK